MFIVSQYLWLIFFFNSLLISALLDLILEFKVIRAELCVAHTCHI